MNYFAAHLTSLVFRARRGSSDSIRSSINNNEPVGSRMSGYKKPILDSHTSPIKNLLMQIYKLTSPLSDILRVIIIHKNMKNSLSINLFKKQMLTNQQKLITRLG